VRSGAVVGGDTPLEGRRNSREERASTAACRQGGNGLPQRGKPGRWARVAHGKEIARPIELTPGGQGRPKGADHAAEGETFEE
jgi:hypothetical protein